MNGILRVESFKKLMALWPDVVQEHESPAEFLALLLAALRGGVIFIVMSEGEPKGVCCATAESTVAVIHCLPTGQGLGFGREMIKHVRKWAQDLGLRHLEISTDKLSGSSFRYFEKTLGFRRSRMTFELEV